MTAPYSHFLSAERSDPETIAAERIHVTGMPLLVDLLDAVPDGVVVLNMQRQIIHCNRAFSSFINGKEPAGQRLGESLNCEHAWENPAGCGTSIHCTTCGAARAMLQAKQGRFADEEVRLSVSGEDSVFALDLRTWATPLTLDGLDVTLLAAQDISGEKRRTALERTFFHDIRNSAGAISGVAQLLQLADESDMDDVHGYGEILDVASGRLVDEIQSYQQLLSAESGDLQVRFAEVDTSDLLQELITTYRAHEIAARRHLQLASSCERHRLQTDPTLLGRVLGNMIKNALEASAADETVTVSCEETETGVRFWVHNTGFIPRHIQLQIFQRSFSTKDTGRGVGTFSMKLLAERYLGGQIDFISTRAGGTTFMVTLPKEA